VRVVFDTNVLVSAFTALGLCHQAYERALLGEDIMTAQGPLSELRRVLSDKMGLGARLAGEIVAAVADDAEVITPLPLALSVCRDPDDDWVLATALAGRAEAIVTGDEDMLALKNHRGVRILTPRAFLEWLDRLP
jgi:uncharacterized protein